MRLKTFVLTYLLFLFILFSSMSVVSIYLTNSQMNMLKDKSAREYQTISATFAKDIAVLYGRSEGLTGSGFSESVDSLVSGYARYYQRYDIEIAVIDLSLQKQSDNISTNAEISTTQREQERFVYITANLPEPFQYYQLEYYSNITDSVREIQNIQQKFLIFSIAFSIIAAFALYSILTRIFGPLVIIANTSRKIAGGQYGERIRVRGKNELSEMAYDFNRMAEVIENQILLLEDEAEKKQLFIDNFAHEIRTPLTSIYGYAEYLQKAPFDETEIIESTHFIMAEANHIKKISNALLELATLRNYTPVKTEILIRLLFERISQTLNKPLEEKNIKLVCKNSFEILYGQEDLIRSLLLNLCFNAIKSCPPNDGVITIEAKEQGENTILSVTDNGCGISEENIARVTEPFYRVDNARSREHGGAGLGLTLCKQISEAHEAEMTIESSVGLGTTVKITFTTS